MSPHTGGQRPQSMSVLIPQPDGRVHVHVAPQSAAIAMQQGFVPGTGPSRSHIVSASPSQPHSAQAIGTPKKDPFAAKPGEPREAAKQSLFRLQIRRGTLAAVRIIGAGQYGEVHLAKQTNPQTGVVIDCAVKLLKDGASRDDKADFLSEAEAMVELVSRGLGTPVHSPARPRCAWHRHGSISAMDTPFLSSSSTSPCFFLRLLTRWRTLWSHVRTPTRAHRHRQEHENLVRILGVAIQQRPWLSVLELCLFGDLGGYLRKLNRYKAKLRFREMRLVSVQIANGMSYMEQKRYVHMDLAARNVMLSHGNVAKVGDFGLTKKLGPKGVPGSDFYRLNKPLKLPIAWMSIESLTLKIFSCKSDVWGFGVVLWELFSYAGTPYKGIPIENIQANVEQGLRLQPPEAMPQLFYEAVVESCWALQPDDRPSFAQLCECIGNFPEIDEGGAGDVSLTGIRDFGVILDQAKLALGLASGALSPRSAQSSPRGSVSIQSANASMSATSPLSPRVTSVSVSTPHSQGQRRGSNLRQESTPSSGPLAQRAASHAGSPSLRRSSFGPPSPSTRRPLASAVAVSVTVMAEVDAVYGGEAVGGFSAADIGYRVTVKGQYCQGTIKFVGNLNNDGNTCIGVELDEPVGDNDGSVKGTRYFQGKPGHGVFCEPSMVEKAPYNAEPDSALVDLDFNGFSESDLNTTVEIDGYGEGLIRFIGLHKAEKTERIGIELDTPIGKNNGTVRGQMYFTCPEKHGLLCDPRKVSRLGFPAGALKDSDSDSDVDPNADSGLASPGFVSFSFNGFSVKDVGCAVEVDSFGRGTLRYVGVHHAFEMATLGIELDGPLGEHNGTFMGRQYFECPDDTGILIEPTTVRRCIGSNSPFVTGAVLAHPGPALPTRNPSRGDKHGSTSTSTDSTSTRKKVVASSESGTRKRTVSQHSNGSAGNPALPPRNPSTNVSDGYNFRNAVADDAPEVPAGFGLPAKTAESSAETPHWLQTSTASAAAVDKSILKIDAPATLPVKLAKPVKVVTPSELLPEVSMVPQGSKITRKKSRMTRIINKTKKIAKGGINYKDKATRRESTDGASDLGSPTPETPPVVTPYRDGADTSSDRSAPVASGTLVYASTADALQEEPATAAATAITDIYAVPIKTIKTKPGDAAAATPPTIAAFESVRRVPPTSTPAAPPAAQQNRSAAEMLAEAKAIIKATQAAKADTRTKQRQTTTGELDYQSPVPVAGATGSMGGQSTPRQTVTAGSDYAVALSASTVAADTTGGASPTETQPLNALHHAFVDDPADSSATTPARQTGVTEADYITAEAADPGNWGDGFTADEASYATPAAVAELGHPNAKVATSLATPKLKQARQTATNEAGYVTVEAGYITVEASRPPMNAWYSPPMLPNADVLPAEAPEPELRATSTPPKQQYDVLDVTTGKWRKRDAPGGEQERAGDRSLKKLPAPPGGANSGPRGKRKSSRKMPTPPTRERQMSKAFQGHRRLQGGDGSPASGMSPATARREALRNYPATVPVLNLQGVPNRSSSDAPLSPDTLADMRFEQVAPWSTPSPRVLALDRSDSATCFGDETSTDHEPANYLDESNFLQGPTPAAADPRRVSWVIDASAAGDISASTSPEAMPAPTFAAPGPPSSDSESDGSETEI